MVLMFWLQVMVILTALILLLAWVITGRRNQMLLRLIAVCVAIMGILSIIRAGR
jgi:hypothetical protein